MASRLEKLLPASFRGIPFLVSSESLTDGGRKIVLHEYPDSDQRFVEDLGGLPPRFRIRAFVTGEDWQDRAKSLENALNKRGPGKLIMPTLGSFRIYSLPYSKDASQQSVGIISFDLEFAIGNPANAPLKSPATVEEVFSKGDDSRGIMQKIFGDDYETPEFIESIKTAIGDVKDFASETLENIKSQIDIESLQALNKKVREIAVKAPQLISDSQALSFFLIQGTTDDPGIWQLASLGFGVSGTLSSVKVLTEYGASLLDSESAQTVTGSSVGVTDDETATLTPYWPETTADRIGRNKRRRLIVRTQRLNALVVGYEQLAAGDYSTTEDIAEARNIIENAYKSIMLKDTDDKTAFQANTEIRNSIEALRAASLEVLEQKEQQTFGLVEFDQVSPISQFALAYKLYAEEITTSEDLTEKARIIRKLNPDQNGLTMQGTLTVLQNRVIV